MKLKYISVAIIVTIISIVISGCGGGGGSASFSNAEQKVIIIDCNTTGAVIPTDFTTMLSADAIIKDKTPTTITTYHDISGNKKICVDIGSAYLLRQ